MINAELNQYIQKHRTEFLEELKALLRMPSISTDSEYSDDVRECAEWLVDHLDSMGVDEARLEETDGHPIVYGEHIEDPSAPTLLVYGHYDVQPPDPLDEWETPPFEPDVRDDKIFARGATDNKGQHFAHLKAIETHLETNGSLPVNIKLLIEGEEEIGSKHLHGWVEDNAELLEADAVVISDSAMMQKGLPTITYSLRGLTYFEVEVTGPVHDLHSGLFGGAVPNPINELSRIIGRLHDDDNKIQIDGFYDNVLELEDEEREEFADLLFDTESFRATTGAAKLKGEKGYTPLEQRWARPTLDCNGIWGGFTGEGAKTVLPSKATAKISCRLVPNQDPERIAEQAEQTIRELADDSVSIDFRTFQGGRPVLVDRHSEPVQAAARASSQAWDSDAVFTRNGGSIPVVGTFDDALDAPIVLLGFGLDDDRLHSPNEKFDLLNFYKGIETSSYLINELANR
jgi:acetylornithine deacetylase/succinyl-diaminopimelate desuccinylase-like protein